MVFSSLVFLFIFLPVVLGVYYIVPRKRRNAFLLLANIIFYGWGEPVYILLMLLCTAVNFAGGALIDKYRDRPRLGKFFLVFSVCFSLLLLGIFKYAGFAAALIKRIPALASIAVPVIPLPVGISFYTFQALSYSIDVYRRDAQVQKNPVTFATYISLFPQLIAGPIVRYKDVDDQLRERHESAEQFVSGIQLFIIGLAKKVLIANQAGALWEALRDLGAQAGWAGAWVGVAAFTLQIYFDFSGYSDMARGLGRMMGFEFMENFNYPYIARSVTDFWRRWHISLSTWFRDYLYIPLGGNRRGPWRQVFNLLIVWFVTGLWHGASGNFIIWGLYYFVLLVLERFVFRRVWDRMPRIPGTVITLFFVMMGWVVFSFTDLNAMWEYFRLLFSFGAPAAGEQARWLALSYLPLLAVAAVAATPLAKNLFSRVSEKRWARPAALVAALAALVLCVAALVSQSYNPFLYYQF